MEQRRLRAVAIFLICHGGGSGEELAFYVGMMLLITSSTAGSELQQALQQAVGDTVELAGSTAAGLRHLRQREFEAIVLDQSLAADPSMSALIQHAGTAVPVSINSALSNCARIVSEVKSALQRRRTDRAAARRAAGRELREDLRNAVTGILLSTELALGAPSLSTGTQARLRQVVQLAEGMKRTLGI
jgi:hypothetical protein